MAATMTAGPTPRTLPRRGPRRRPRLLVASIVLAAPGWIGWAVQHRGLPTAVATSAVLAANAVVTWRVPGLKRRAVRLLQRYVVNPPVRVLLAIGVLPLGIALLETSGRRTNQPRRNPVGEGREGDVFWIVAEHGSDAGYVRNIEADPHVRVRLRRGLMPRWVEGVATIVSDEDPHALQRRLCRWHPLRALNAMTVRAMGTDLVVVRIDLR